MKDMKQAKDIAREKLKVSMTDGIKVVVYPEDITKAMREYARQFIDEAIFEIEECLVF